MPADTTHFLENGKDLCNLYMGVGDKDYIKEHIPNYYDQLFAWGNNSGGQLGLGDPVHRSSPVQVGALNTWASVSGGSFHSLATKIDGSLWSWGSNSYGQLGLGDIVNRSSSVQIAGNTWSSVSGGADHSLAIQEAANGDRTLWSWGRNANGQLGLGDLVHRSSPVQVGALNTWASVSGGYAHSLAIQEAANGDRTLWSWGRNTNGQLGDGSVTHRSSPVQIAGNTWSSVSGGADHSLAIQEAANGDRTLWSWGYNTNGQLGKGDIVHRSSPTQITGNTWSSVSGGYAHSLATKTDGSLWAWGYNTYGQLGLGDIVHRSSPVQVGALTTWSSVSAGGYHSLATKTDGSLWTWGYNANGQLGDGSVTRSSPVQVGALNTWSSVSGGNGHSLATGL